tara:strand:+ start:4674 stop:5105 length:432 start_codon:yes stop_codon:yes gene_type:complete
MNILPRLERCPCCHSVNILRINSIKYDNEFKCLSKFTLKKTFKCKKCKEEIGIFVNQNQETKKLLWLSEIQIDEDYYNALKKLKDKKNKLNKTKLGKNYNLKKDEISHKIESINKIIYDSKIKLKIKFKIQKRLGSTNHPFDH